MSGIFGGSKAPAAPDPYKVSAAQTQSNVNTAREQARLNALDQFGPYGTSEFIFDPKTNTPVGQKTTLTPELQALLNSQIGSQQGLSNAVSGQLTRLPQASFDPNSVASTQEVADTAFRRQSELLKPQFEQRKQELAVSLSERGIPVGSKVYNDEMNRFDTAQNASLASAADNAYLQSGQEQQRLLSNAVSQYNMPYAQLSQLMGLSTPANIPNPAPQTASQVANTDVAGNVWNAYNAQVAAANQKNASSGGLLQSLGSAAMGMFF